MNRVDGVERIEVDLTFRQRQTRERQCECRPARTTHELHRQLIVHGERLPLIGHRTTPTNKQRRRLAARLTQSGSLSVDAIHSNPKAS